MEYTNILLLLLLLTHAVFVELDFLLLKETTNIPSSNDIVVHKYHFFSATINLKLN